MITMNLFSPSFFSVGVFALTCSQLLAFTGPPKPEALPCGVIIASVKISCKSQHGLWSPNGDTFCSQNEVCGLVNGQFKCPGHQTQAQYMEKEEDWDREEDIYRAPNPGENSKVLLNSWVQCYTTALCNCGKPDSLGEKRCRVDLTTVNETAGYYKYTETVAPCPVAPPPE